MGSGSSRSGRTLRRRRSPESLPGGPGAAVPEGGTGRRVPAAAEAPGAAAEEAPGRDPSPEAPPDGRDETLRLLDQLLAESAAWVAPEPAPRRPARPRPAAGEGSLVAAEQSTEEHVGKSSTCEVPDSSCKRPATISYDHAEEGLMASIEREYCR
ncbi:cystin-1 [Sapajus apella]|uniref:Cystin-1 n=1 Tax=Sapajus apella TaxID=9515 RepID=A0A6J3J6L7_SAPAP|nr:cystin-1 [Sapajus apella]